MKKRGLYGAHYHLKCIEKEKVNYKLNYSMIANVIYQMFGFLDNLNNQNTFSPL
ncbi:hypothetical protein NEF87_003127 [Candidatus Lokiarchaeum ossiferum]|uniref:Uncharacterized protein n=1 Tax=Candidatus Lokiarchaeum ossiferum TaxID=2951803 RepID=A0ABY6HVE3_9ARCH|nr:hypothetical protein NEF87_003127 [Candidatus Lokiarchaeum sp. B-35]